ncbi:MULTISPECIES: adenylate/guanylate cyclase domain-containing protein [unclassified Thioalkalivibrio]|uniref:adenylate/guanylate cyclase domain-containing protein n=1 Tax=unclassified Thioalkalivibrio TaxID=2621013 RepID=UPI000379B9B0|nr:MULTISPECIES: adenylate/guanylate cyclase domain-containing protein [unclassified Thioalkalivibrio]
MIGRKKRSVGARLSVSGTDFTPRYLPIAWKIVAAIAGLTLAGIVTLSAVVLNQVSNVLDNQIRAQAEITVAPVARTSAELMLAEDYLTLETLLNSLVEEGRVESIAAYAIDRGQVARAGTPPEQSLTDGVWPLAPTVEPYRREVLFQDVQVGYIEAYIDTSPMQELIRNTLNAGIATAIGVFLLSLLLAIDISKRLVRPLERLAESMRSRIRPMDDQGNPLPMVRQDEIAQLTDAFNDMARDLLRKDQVEAALRRYVSDAIAQDILENLDRVELGGRAVEGSVLFADIQGYTALSERCSPEALGRMLNEFFGPMSECIARHGGTVDKYMGDCTMAVFGLGTDAGNHRLTAVQTGLALLETVASINAERERRGETRVEFRIGLNAGEMLAGNMGAEDRMQFTVVGDTVNLAARLVTVAPPGGLVTTAAFMEHEQVKGHFHTEDWGTHELHGVSESVAVTRVLNSANHA